MHTQNQIHPPVPQHLETIVRLPSINSPTKHTATIIFFHGLGETHNILIKSLHSLLGRNLLAHQPHIKLVFPLAQRRPLTALGGRLINAWFDLHGHTRNSIDIPEHRQSFARIDRQVCDLIAAEVAAGIPLDRIAVGGFSMGGMMAIHTAYRLRPDIAGVFVLSAYLNFDNQVYDKLVQPEQSVPGAKLLMLHGDRDERLPHDWGRITFGELHRLGVHGEFRTIVGMKHEMRADELLQVENWLAELLPAAEIENRTRLECKL